MEERKCSFIYLPNTKHIPAPDYTSRRLFNNILLRYAPFAIVEDKDCSPYDELKVCKAAINQKLQGFVVSPTTKQFRVHVCTELYYTHHVSLLFIQKCMGHLSDEMQGYYVRPKNKATEEAEASQKLLKEVVQKNVTLLGGKGQEVTEQIERFIREGNYQVENNLDELLEYLDGQVAIRVSLACQNVSKKWRERTRDKISGLH